MSEKAWCRLGYMAFTVMVFICAVIAIHWAIDFIAWSKLDSGWAQAIGSTFALAIAIYIAEKQNKSAIRLLQLSERNNLQWRLNCVEAILGEAESELNKFADKISGTGSYARDRKRYELTHPNDVEFQLLTAALGSSLGRNTPFADIVERLNQVPIHELGNGSLVNPVLEFRRLLSDLDSRILDVVNNYDLEKLMDTRACFAMAKTVAASNCFIFGMGKQELLSEYDLKIN